MASTKIEALIKEIENEAASRVISDPAAFGIMCYGLPIAHIAALRQFFIKHTGLNPDQLYQLSSKEIAEHPVRSS